MLKDKTLLLFIFLCLVLFALIVTPRSKQNYDQFAKTYKTYREMQEVVPWSH